MTPARALSAVSLRAALLVPVLSLAAGAAFAQTSAGHTVRIEVRSIQGAAITGGDVTLTIGDRGAGSGPGQVGDSTTCHLAWAGNATNQKVTVVSNVAPTAFILRVEALKVSGGQPAGPVTLGVTPQDLIADISKTHGHCDLGYTASCRDPLPEPVTEAYVIAYTVTDAR